MKKQIKVKATKEIKKAVSKTGKNAVSAKTKKAAVKKTKGKISSRTNKPAGKVKAPVKKAKTPVAAKAIVSKKVPAKKKAAVAKNTASKPAKQAAPASVIMPHGPDQHFIPAHNKELPARIKDGKKVEQLFHHNEEVALHQENQVAKASMASRMGRKRIFRNPRFS